MTLGLSVYEILKSVKMLLTALDDIINHIIIQNMSCRQEASRVILALNRNIVHLCPMHLYQKYICTSAYYLL